MGGKKNKQIKYYDELYKTVTDFNYLGIVFSIT